MDGDSSGPLQRSEAALEHQLDDTVRRAKVIFDLAMDGIIIIDREGTIGSFNPAAERIFGYRANDIIGQNVNVLMSGYDHEHHANYLARYLRTGESRIIGVGREVTGRHRDGHGIDLKLALAEFQEADQRFFVGFTHDVTERNRARREAQKYLDELAHLNRVNAMGELVANLTHEIRQPLMAIQVSAHTAKQCQQLPDAQARLDEALDRIERQSQHANEILKHLTEFLRKADSAPKEQVAISNVLGEVFELLRHDNRLAGVNLKLDIRNPPCSIKGNRVQIQQVLYNIVRNAMEAMEGQEGMRTLRIASCAVDDPGQCHVDIVDSGPGIDAQHIDQLFDPFFTTKSQGLGQGLSISRSIARSHGGDLSAHNDPNGGARFRLTLPLAGDDDERD